MLKELDLERLTHLEDPDAEAVAELLLEETEAEVPMELGEDYLMVEKNHVREDNIVKKEETLKKENANKLN